jgi:hypothetical protein
VKKLLLLSISFLLISISFAQIKSPEEFLGYPIGTRYTPHYQLVNYFQYVSQAAPDMVKLQKYGETNEHRPLYLSFISSKENIGQLEKIRLNNMALANSSTEKITPTEETPVIVWLSYNVHGNETSSSEASMLTLYALVNPANLQSKEWLKNTIVVIDPCLNPDGRERYINWYNSMIGKDYNPLAIAREHREPWPGGRSNHYNFDLNRDWVWQTQVESRQRLAQYNQWLPQIHVDFHEQGVNEPYYFAPAAEPYHEVLTKWQRDFQKTIGRNHAKYFDKNGWLYFTNHRFDLFYPSYGDTYPLYNGSIGMTYEQGGISAGLGILTDEKDTLTLTERSLHHFTTGMSTIETASKNASQLIGNFHQYFNDASNGKAGAYKTYIIKNNPDDKERIQAFLKLLDQNGIQYGTASGSGKGFHYQNKKEEGFTVEKGDIAISSSQPRGVMVKVLMEPQSILADSITYDITAWSLPYVYGLDAYATTQNMNVNSQKSQFTFVNNTGEDAYGYVIRWQGVSTVKTIAKLLKKGIRMRYTETPFEINGQQYGSGSVIITKKGNSSFGNDLWKTVSNICNENQINLNKVATGMVDKGVDFGGDLVHEMKAPRVFMLTGENVSSLGAGEIWNFFDNEIDYKINLINASDFNRMNLNEVDVLILPDGYYRFLNDSSSAKDLENWIQKGGKLIALESAVSQLSKQKWSTLKSKNPGQDLTDTSKKKNSYIDLKIYANRERDQITDYIPGAIFKVEVDNTHPLMFGYPSYYYTLKMDNAVYEFIKKDGWNVGVIKKENQISGFVGSKLEPKLKDGLVFGVQDLGRGNVIYLTDDVMFRNFWQNGKLILCNAVFLVGQ